VQETLAKEFEDKRHFIAANPLFDTWAPKYRKQLTMALYKEYWPYDSVLVRQGEPVEYVYFILRYLHYTNLVVFKWYGHVTRSSVLAKNHPARDSTRGEKKRQTEEEVGGQY
jgi:hypothetical protein